MTSPLSLTVSENDLKIFNSKNFYTYLCKFDKSKFNKYGFFTEDAFYKYVIEIINTIINNNIYKNNFYFIKTNNKNKDNVYYEYYKNKLFFKFNKYDKYNNIVSFNIIFNKEKSNIDENIILLAEKNYFATIDIEINRDITMLIFYYCLLMFAIVICFFSSRK